MNKYEKVEIYNNQEEISVRFTLLFHASCGKMQRINQNRIALSARTMSEVASLNICHS